MLFVLFISCIRPSPAKLTIGTIVPVVAGATTILINGKTLIEGIKHPKRTVKKVKSVIKGT
jgi:hypothetical protein